jgi:hypothetical protein
MGRRRNSMNLSQKTCLLYIVNFPTDDGLMKVIEGMASYLVLGKGLLYY